jgi:hypothetical protein
MTNDLIIDFDHHLNHNKVYLVEVYMPLQDAPADAPNFITADVYVVANSYHQAQYIVNTMYPDSDLYVYESPITPYQYSTRRN